MKKHKKALVCAFSAALAILAAAPFAAYADEETVFAAADEYDEITTLCGEETAEVMDAEAEISETSADSPETHTSEWVRVSEGEIFYYDENGVPLTGVQTIDGEKYLFSKDGTLKTGWRTVDGVRKYYDPESGKPVYGKIEYCGNTYLIDREEGKTTGKIKNSDGTYYLYDDNGIMQEKNGFVNYGGSSYYVRKDMTLAVGNITIRVCPCANCFHRKIVNIRKDFLNKLSSKIANSYDYVIIENLSIKEIVYKLGKGKNAYNTSFCTFVKKLSYKVKGEIVKINKWFPSSKKCSNCGKKKKHLKLSQRVYRCAYCGNVIDRDLNAAINIKQEGLKVLGDF